MKTPRRSPWRGVVEWRATSLQGYIVSSEGAVVSLCGQYGRPIKQLTQHLDATGYARVNAAGRSRLTHRLVADAFDVGGPFTDHRDRDRGNPALSNLRPATRSQNGGNTVGRNSTGAKGVHRSGARFRAILRVNGCARNLGSFATVGEASDAYNTAAAAVFGEFACVTNLGGPSRER